MNDRNKVGTEFEQWTAAGRLWTVQVHRRGHVVILSAAQVKAKLRAFTVYKRSDEVLINPAEVTNFHAVFSNSRAFTALSEVTK